MKPVKINLSSETFEEKEVNKTQNIQPPEEAPKLTPTLQKVPTYNPILANKFHITALFNIKNILWVMGVGVSTVAFIVSVGYYQVYTQSLPKFEPDTNFVYQFPAGKPPRLLTSAPVVGNADPNSNVQIGLTPKNNILGISEVVKTDNLGFWTYVLPDNLSSGSYDLVVTPSGGDSNKYDVEIIPSISEPAPTQPEPSPVLSPEPTIPPGESPSPVPSCDDSQIYCQDGIKIWKHSSTQSGSECSYVYDEIGECESGSGSASPTPAPQISPKETPTPTPAPDPNCTEETYYCSFKFLLKETRVWEDNMCKIERNFVKDSTGKKVKCSCQAPLTFGVCKLPSSKNMSKRK